MLKIKRLIILILWLITFNGLATANPGISLPAFKVSKVFDGDTILLEDGRKIRLLGINTPEIASFNKQAEVGGDKAFNWLKQQLSDKKVSIETDVEQFDKYGRTLAYIFREDNTFINLELLKTGLAFLSLFPPNLKYADSLIHAQQNAIQNNLGIWTEKEYATARYDTLNLDNYHGWKRLTGQAQTIYTTKNSHYLAFSEQVSIQIEQKYLDLFPPLDSYLHKKLEVRAWPYVLKQKFIIPVKHPAQIQILD